MAPASLKGEDRCFAGQYPADDIGGTDARKAATKITGVKAPCNSSRTK